MIDHQKFTQAFAARKPEMKKEGALGTDTFRLFTGEREGVAGLRLDRFGDVLFLQCLEGEAAYSDFELRDLSKHLCEMTGAQAVYRKLFPKDRSASVGPEINASAQPLWGKPAPKEYVANESGMSFLIRPYDGFANGLYLDQRLNRRLFRKGSTGRVLNLFSYTCGFSVAAALGGADQVTSVDVSPKALAWGKENFVLNSVDTSAHRFVAEDAATYLGRVIKRGERFDAIIFDPPTFARAKGKTFSLKQAWVSLFRSGMELLVPGGKLFFSCNNSEWNTEWLKRELKKKIPVQLGTWEWLSLPPVPFDYAPGGDPTSRIFLRGSGALDLD